MGGKTKSVQSVTFTRLSRAGEKKPHPSYNRLIVDVFLQYINDKNQLYFLWQVYWSYISSKLCIAVFQIRTNVTVLSGPHPGCIMQTFNISKSTHGLLSLFLAFSHFFSISWLQFLMVLIFFSGLSKFTLLASNIRCLSSFLSRQPPTFAVCTATCRPRFCSVNVLYWCCHLFLGIIFAESGASGE